MFADEIRRAAEAAPRAKLPDISKLLWTAFAAGNVTEAEAGTLSALIEALKVVPVPPVKGVGSRPRTDASLARRRAWVASGRLPPAIATRFTPGETAALAVIATEVKHGGECTLAIGGIAGLAGVSETTVRNALRAAKEFGFVTVEERRISMWRNDTNVVRIVSTAWNAWLRLGPQPSQGGCKSVKGSNTQGSKAVNSGDRKASKGFRKSVNGPTRQGFPGTVLEAFAPVSARLRGGRPWPPAKQP